MHPETDQTFFSAPLVAIVDDDLMMRLTIRRLLRTFGYRTATFASGEEFLASDHRNVACVILDLRLPGIDGLGVQQRLKRSEPPLPVIFVSADASDDQVQRAHQEGAVRFLLKPIAAEDVLTSLDHALRQHPRLPRPDGTHANRQPHAAS